MTAFFAGVGTILHLELLQRVRNRIWFVMLGIFVALIAIVTAVLFFAFNGLTDGNFNGGVYSTIIYFVLLLSTLVTPALSGNAINGDRDAGTLATTQVTLITTWQLILGKFFAAWIAALAFLAAALPFLVFAAISGRVSAGTIVISVLVLAVELGVVAAIGIGLSGLIGRPLFSIVLSYLVVAALSVGTLIAFTIAGLAVQTTVTTSYNQGVEYSQSGRAITCELQPATSYQTPRYDLFWPILSANPYVLLADAVPTTYSTSGYPDDLFGTIKLGVRSAQNAPPAESLYDDCNPQSSTNFQTQEPREVIDSTAPGWFVGLIIHLVLAAGALVGAWSRTRTPAAKLGRDTRVA